MLAAGPPVEAQTAAPRRAAAVVVYRPPVSGPVIDAFRPPAHVGAPGNRGLEYATGPGTAVRASADGVVTFAGKVGRAAHVTVAHADGVRTTYSFLASVAVRAGQSVAAGQVLGTAGATLHFGARIGEAYVDPGVLLGEAGRVRLVPAALRASYRDGARALPQPLGGSGRARSPTVRR